MSKYNNMILTKKGRRLLAKVQVGECDMVITRAVVGCGEYDGSEELSETEQLKSPIQAFGVSSFQREDDQILIRFIVSNFDLDAGIGTQSDYYIREIGIYAEEKGIEEEVLYGVVTADVPAFMPAYDEASPVTVTFQVYVYVGDGEKVAIRAEPAAYVLNDDFSRELGNMHEAIDHAYSNANQFTLQKIAALVNGAPETLDTLKEVAEAISENESVVAALDAAVGKKANQSEVDTHTGNTTVHVTKSERDAWNGKLTPSGNVSDTIVVFTQASSRANLRTGEKLSIVFGKIAKWFADLKTVAFTGNYADLSGRPTIPAAVAVKGNAEGSYRTGNVNLTPANIGAAAAGHTHSYAGSSSAGGAATSAVKLTSSAGSAVKPVYFSGGKPVACAGSVGTTRIKTFSNISISEYQSANSVGLGDGYFWPCYYSQLKDLSAFSDVESYSDVPINFYVSLVIPERRYEGIAHYILYNKKFHLLGQDAPCPSASIKPFRSCTADYITFIGFMVSEVYKDTFSLTICATY